MSSEEKLNPSFWNKISRGPPPPKKQPSLLKKYQQQQAKAKSKSSSSSSSDGNENNNDIVETRISLSSSSSSVKQPRFSKQQAHQHQQALHTRSEELKEQIEDLIELRLANFDRRDALEEAESVLQQRIDLYARQLNEYNLTDRLVKRPPPIICQESPLLAAIRNDIVSAGGSSDTSSLIKPITSRRLMTSLLRVYNKERLFEQVAAGRLRLVSGLYGGDNRSNDISPQYAFIVALDNKMNNRVVFYNIYRV